MPVVRHSGLDAHRRREDLRPAVAVWRLIVLPVHHPDADSILPNLRGTSRTARDPDPGVVRSFFFNPAVLSFIGAVAGAAILSWIFLLGGEGISLGADCARSPAFCCCWASASSRPRVRRDFSACHP